MVPRAYDCSMILTVVAIYVSFKSQLASTDHLSFCKILKYATTIAVIHYFSSLGIHSYAKFCAFSNKATGIVASTSCVII